MANKIILSAVSILLGCSALAQTTTIAPPKPQPEQSTTVEPEPERPTLHTGLVCVDDKGKRTTFTPSQWKALSLQEKQKYGKMGIDVRYGDQHFTLGLRDYHSVPLDYVGGQVPTSAQWQTIMANRNAINKAIEALGGDPIDDGLTYSYWHKGEKSKSLKTARLCAKGSGKFADAVMKPAHGEGYETVGETIDGITVGICNERYGYVDDSGRCVVPAKYEYLSIYGTACDNGIYGMIRRDGTAIVPFIYDGMIAGKYLTVVYQEGLCGAFDNNGRLIIPIEYDDVVPGKNAPMAMVKKGECYALINASGREVTPHSYDKVVSAQDYGFAVGRNGKSLYLGFDGKEYGNAYDMKTTILSRSIEPEDQYALAKMLYDSKDYFESMKYAQPAASAGYAPAQCLMGHFYAHGHASASKSDSKAFEWYEKSARQGCDEGAYCLAQMYENGRGTYRNHKLAAEWYRKCNGYADANERLKKLGY